MRLFIAATLPESGRRQIICVQEQLRRVAQRGSFTRPENLHVTLKFLGEVPAQQLALFQSAFQQLSPTPPYLVRFQRLFAQRGREGALVRLDLVEEGGLSAFAEGIDAAFARLGITRERRAFLPHITLGRRVFFEGDLRQVTLPDTEFRLPAVALFLSEQTVHGMRYTPLTTLAL